MVFYLTGLYVAVHFGDLMLAISYAEAARLATGNAAAFNGLLYGYPIASLPISMFLLAALAGQPASSPTRATVFVNGLMACCGGNIVAFHLGRLIVGSESAGAWAEHLNSYRLNILTAFVAPGLAFVVAFALAATLSRASSWIKPE